MNTPEADGAALLRAIIESPDEDMPRLMYADWLDENAAYGEPLPTPRAELIRVQCELARQPAEDQCAQCYSAAIGGQKTNGPCRCTPLVRSLRIREKWLIGTHADAWRKGPACTRCVNGWTESRTRVAEMDADDESGYSRSRCAACAGTGDGGGLMVGLKVGTGASPHRVTYSRGMARVHCTLADAIARQRVTCELCGGTGTCYELDMRRNEEVAVRCPKCCQGKPLQECGTVEQWAPTDWLNRVLTHRLDVTELWVTDRVPRNDDDLMAGWRFYRDGGGLVWDDGDGDVLPGPLYVAMGGKPHGSDDAGVMGFPSPEAGQLLLARALAAFARSRACK